MSVVIVERSNVHANGLLITFGFHFQVNEVIEQVNIALESRETSARVII